MSMLHLQKEIRGSEWDVTILLRLMCCILEASGTREFNEKAETQALSSGASFSLSLLLAPSVSNAVCCVSAIIQFRASLSALTVSAPHGSGRVRHAIIVG